MCQPSLLGPTLKTTSSAAFAIRNGTVLGRWCRNQKACNTSRGKMIGASANTLCKTARRYGQLSTLVNALHETNTNGTEYDALQPHPNNTDAYTANTNNKNNELERHDTNDNASRQIGGTDRRTTWKKDLSCALL